MSRDSLLLLFSAPLDHNLLLRLRLPRSQAHAMAKITITGLRRLQSHSKDDTDRDQGERTVPADTEDAVYEGDVRPSWLDLTPAQLTTRLSHLVRVIACGQMRSLD